MVVFQNQRLPWSQTCTLQVDFLYAVHTNTQTMSYKESLIKQIPFEKSPLHSVMVSFNSQRSFHLFILRRVYRQCLYCVPSDKTQSLHSFWNVSVEIWEGWAPGVGLHQITGPSLPYPERAASSLTEREQELYRKLGNFDFTIKAKDAFRLRITLLRRYKKHIYSLLFGTYICSRQYVRPDTENRDN